VPARAAPIKAARFRASLVQQRAPKGCRAGSFDSPARSPRHSTGIEAANGAGSKREESQMATQNASKRPTHYLYAVTERGNSDKGFWTRIGAAWPNSDGKGFNFKLDLIPLSGDIVMREPKEDAGEGDAK